VTNEFLWLINFVMLVVEMRSISRY
jgi:hypothetical protein